MSMSYGLITGGVYTTAGRPAGVWISGADMLTSTTVVLIPAAFVTYVTIYDEKVCLWHV